MNKIIVVLIIFIVIFSLIGCSLHEQNRYGNETQTDEAQKVEKPTAETVNVDDSFHISDENAQLLNKSESDVVIKIFWGYFLSDFASKQPIDTIINKQEELYTVFTQDGKIEAMTIDGNQVEKEDLSNSELVQIEYLCQTATNYERLFKDQPDDFEVSQIFCFRENIITAPDQIIYFVTNYGHYVYYATAYSSENKLEYIFTYDEYCDVINEYVTEKNAFVNEDRLGNMLVGGKYPLYYFCDVTEYNIKNIDYAGFTTVGEISSAGVEKSQFGDNIFYSALGDWYVARILEDKSVREIRKISAKVITADDLKKIEVGMDMFELVETAGLPSRSTFALVANVPIFDSDDGGYAVVCLDENSRVKSVTVRSAEELSGDLREGMSENDISQDESVKRIGQYVFFDINGRWCVSQIKDSVIVKVRYYESHNIDNCSFENDINVGLVGNSLFKYIKDFGIPQVIIVEGTELLVFEMIDGSNMVLELDEAGEKIQSVRYNISFDEESLP